MSRAESVISPACVTDAASGVAMRFVTECDPSTIKINWVGYDLVLDPVPCDGWRAVFRGGGCE